MKANSALCGVPNLSNSSSGVGTSGIVVSGPRLDFTLKNGGQDSVVFRLTKVPSATVTITGIDNTNYGISANFTINYGPSVSADISYSGLTGSSSTIVNRDHRKLIFGPNPLYTRPNGNAIMTTNSASIYVFGPDLNNSVYTTGDSFWTGFQNTSDWIGGGGCTSWTSTGTFGSYSVGNATAFQSLLFGGNLACNNTCRLYCVQQ